MWHIIYKHLKHLGFAVGSLKPHLRPLHFFLLRSAMFSLHKDSYGLSVTPFIDSYIKVCSIKHCLIPIPSLCSQAMFHDPELLSPPAHRGKSYFI